MTSSSTAAAPGLAAWRPVWRRGRRPLLWGALIGLLLVAQSALVMLTIAWQHSRAQEAVDAAAATAVTEVRARLARDVQLVQALLWNEPAVDQWRADASELLRLHREVMRLEWRDAHSRIVRGFDSPYGPGLFATMSRGDMDVEAELACTTAVRVAGPIYSRSYFVPMGDGLGAEVVDLCVPDMARGVPRGYVVATVSLAGVLEDAMPRELLAHHEVSFTEADGTRLARSGASRGAGVFVADRLVDLPGSALQLRLDSVSGRPRILPNLGVAMVLGLSLALLLVVLLLAHDVRRRARVETALAESLAFRKAMEDSLVTGLRARDLDGRITYVNPAFCRMVGWSARELVGQTVPAYWPPERIADNLARHTARSESGLPPEQREGYEAVFLRRNGERFPVMVYEAPLVDGAGRHTGWMSAVVDVGAQRRVEELSRQQQERLQATARLASAGELASMLSHELNQPLAAIASYASGSLNLLGDPEQAADPAMLPMLRQALQRVAEQAERAGRVIKSVHGLVRRREQAREAIGVDQLFDAVLPLVTLHARKSGARVEVDLPAPAPRVLCDRTMVEQALLNLTRNGLQAMESATPLERRVLTLRARRVAPRWVGFSIIDHGSGIAPEVAKQLFTPFFTTRAEGMGLGLSLCRSIVEQHGGEMDFENRSGPDGRIDGVEVRFTLPAAEARPRPTIGDTGAVTRDGPAAHRAASADADALAEADADHAVDTAAAGIEPWPPAGPRG